MNSTALISKAKELKQNCLSCKKCSLGVDVLDGFDPHVYAYGNVNSIIFFVAEAPGFNETEQKKPLVGRSGKVYQEYILDKLELKREDVWTTNTCLCRPPNNRKPTKKEMELCNHHLVEQLNLIKPKLVITLGAVPMEIFLGVSSGITKMAGQKFFSERYNVDTFVLLHPSWFLRNHNFALLEKHVNILKSHIHNLA